MNAVAAKKATTKAASKPRAVNRVQQIQQKKKALLDALEESLGVVTTACRLVGVDRGTFYNYYNDDPEFAAKVDDIENIALDFAESELYKQIGNGEVSSTIFYLKTKGKKRGYIEKSQQEFSGSIETTGQISQRELAMRIVLEAVKQGYSFADAVAALKSLDAPDLPAEVRNEVAGYLLESNEVN